MSEHIKMFKTTADNLEKYKGRETLTFTDFITDSKIKWSNFVCRLDSITKRFSIIINKSKKLTKNKFPVILKKSTAEKYFWDEATYFADKIKKLRDNNELDMGSLEAQYLFKWRTIMTNTYTFITRSAPDEDIVLTI